MSENDDGTDSVLAMLRQPLSKSKETLSFKNGGLSQKNLRLKFKKR